MGKDRQEIMDRKLDALIKYHDLVVELDSPINAPMLSPIAGTSVLQGKQNDQKGAAAAAGTLGGLPYGASEDNMSRQSASTGPTGQAVLSYSKGNVKDSRATT